MLKKIIKILAVIMFIVGVALTFYPWIQKWIGENSQHEKIIQYEKQINDLTTSSLNQLKSDMQNYNKNIYENHQSDLQDAWSYEQEAFSLDSYGIDNSVIGILEVDAMSMKIPLYLGASQDNLSKGAAILGQTSMPLGGENTNTVIAAHRGYHGESMFRDIENLEKGDIIHLTNPWQTLTYKVYQIAVITPDNINAIKIIEGQDMLTLMTCHPYTKNYQRYVVYCIREDQYDDINIDQELDKRSQDIDYELSSSDILKEKNLSIITLSVFSLGLFIIVLMKIYKYKSKKN